MDRISFHTFFSFIARSSPLITSIVLSVNMSADPNVILVCFTIIAAVVVYGKMFDDL